MSPGQLVCNVFKNERPSRPNPPHYGVITIPESVITFDRNGRSQSPE
jgi:hypothetical protein